MKTGLAENNLLQFLPRTRRTLLRDLGRLADRQGLSIYLVGGVVRDLLLRRTNWDLDITVEGDGLAFARMVARRYRAGLALFDRFATARLTFPDGIKLDIASTRRESYARPAALPDVETASLNVDLYRRDFTINSMAIRLNATQFGRFHDPYGGRRDLAAKTIRVLHSGSFRDDPTRIFRAIRFTERFGFHLEPVTRRLLEEAAATDVVGRLSGPRLCNELLMLMNERDPDRSIRWLVRLKLLRFVHARLRHTRKCRHVVAGLARALIWWNAQIPNHPVDRPLIYLTALLSQSGPVVLHSVCRRLQLSSRESSVLEWAGSKTDRLIYVLTGTKNVRPSQVFHLLADIPDDVLVLLVAKGFAKGKSEMTRRLTRRLSRFVRRDRDMTIRLNGDTLKRLGLAPGPQFRTILDAVLDARVDGVVQTASEECDLASRLVKRWMKATRHSGGSGLELSAQRSSRGR